MDKKQVPVKNQNNEKNEASPFRVQSFNLLPEMDRILHRFLGNRFQPLMNDWPTVPRHAMGEVQETENEYVLSAEIPGIPREAVKINLSGNMLSIQAEHQEESGKETSPRGYRRQYQNFSQSFTLPSNVDTENIQAHYENGVLEVVLPKTADTKTKSIQIKSGRSSSTEKSEAPGKKH